MSAERIKYWLDAIDRSKFSVVTRLLEYEAELERAEQPVDAKNNLAVIEDVLTTADESRARLDGYDDCIIGLTESNMRLVYSRARIFKALRKFCKTHLEALDYYEFNVLPVAEGLDVVIVDDMMF